MHRFLLLALLTSACAHAPAHSSAATDAANVNDTPANQNPTDDVRPAVEDATETAPDAAERAQIDPDGNDDPVSVPSGTLPAESHFERVGAPPKHLTRICDLRVFHDALYSAHAVRPLGSDGATIARFNPDDAPSPFRLAFDWNRPGEPSGGGGGGQGFVRIHALSGRLFVPDADPPHNGFGITERGTEGFVFVSDAAGEFAPPRAPHHLPPLAPDGERAGAGRIPRAYHVLDVIRFRGRYYVATGSVPPQERAWTGPSPGALSVADATLARWTYEVDYPYPWQRGVWRLGYLVRFRDRLYAGIQDYDGREPNDFVMFTPPADAPTILREHTHPQKITPRGGSLTLRWYADSGRLFWIALERGTWRGILAVTSDGAQWRELHLPPGAGRPTDVTRFRDALVVLTEGGLYRLDATTESFTELTALSGGDTPFGIDDIFCAAPLAVYRDTLYAGAQRGGALWKLVDGPAPPPPPTPR